jgi:hypothetical protein
MLKIGFAINTYDKFEETQILIDILQKEFKGHYPIAFCTDHPDGKSFANENNLEIFVKARDIPFYPHNNHSLYLRTSDKMQKVCSASLKLDADYIMYLHSDAWVLNENKLNELITELADKNKMIGFREADMTNPSKIGEYAPVGQMDDHFVVFNREFAEEIKLFDYTPEYMFPHINNPHCILSLLFFIKAGLPNIVWYRDTHRMLCYDGKELPDGGVMPSSFDPYYHFLHVNIGALDKYGKAVQAMYLNRYDFQSSFIKSFIKKHYIPDEILIDSLLELERKYNRKLRLLFANKYRLRTRSLIEKTDMLKRPFYRVMLNGLFFRFFYFLRDLNLKYEFKGERDIFDIYRKRKTMDRVDYSWVDTLKWGDK